jgi:hypothetical protein
VSLCGYPATTGLPQIDFKIVDCVTDPGPDQDNWYTEKLYRLNRPFACYAPAPTAPPVAPSPLERNGFVTFGCFNRRSKINRPMLSLWAEILRRTPAPGFCSITPSQETLTYRPHVEIRSPDSSAPKASHPEDWNFEATPRWKSTWPWFPASTSLSTPSPTPA